MMQTTAGFDWRTPICERFDLASPLFGFSHSVQVVAAVTNCGGLGVYGATRRLPHEIESELSEIRRLVGRRPFGVDLVIPGSMPDRDDRAGFEAQVPPGHREFVDSIARRFEVPAPSGPGMRTRFVRSREMTERQLGAVLAADVDLVALGIGCPPEVVERAKARGKTTLALVGQERHARKALAAGADILVAQGADAGGHTGSVGTFTLLPRVVALAGSTPVLAAGGVATGAHIAAALLMGAQGVWMGTALLLTEENRAHLTPNELAALTRAQATDTVVSRGESGKPFRQTRSAWSEAWAAPDAPAPLEHPLHDMLVGDLLGAIREHDVAPLAHSGAGQGIGWFDRVRPVAEIMTMLAGQTEVEVARFVRRFGLHD